MFLPQVTARLGGSAIIRELTLPFEPRRIGAPDN